MDDIEELEFALREYIVATEYLMDVLSKHEHVPASIAEPLMELADAITDWSEVDYRDGL